MIFPVKIVFKLLALAPQMYVADGSGNGIGYVRQKLLAFKESVTVFTDDTQTKPIYTIKADRVIDFNARYEFMAPNGAALGSLKREGVRSLWKAHYMIAVGDSPTFDVHEESAFVRLLDNLVGQIPFINLLTGYFFNPTYIITRVGGGEALRMVKRPSLFESTFTVDQKGSLTPNEQQCALLGLMMVILLERSRG